MVVPSQQWQHFALPLHHVVSLSLLFLFFQKGTNEASSSHMAAGTQHEIQIPKGRLFSVTNVGGSQDRLK
jgi:hypothetical protein